MSYEWPNDFWPNQTRGCVETVAAYEEGLRRLVLTSPTGTGKSRIMVALLEWANSMSWPSVLYTHRRMLLQQTAGVLDKHGVEYGMRASGYEPALLRDIQIAMIQTELSAVLRRQSRDLHPAKLVLVDELHASGGDTLPGFLAQHYEQGALIVGITATPLDLVGEWDRLIIAGTTSEGRDCGALVLAYTFCPDEPDMKLIRKYKVQENGTDLTDKQNADIIMRPGIFGRVYDHWKRLNPNAKPTILFGPDVGGSLFFAKEFAKKGVNAAHIDAKEIWWNGENMPSNDENRQMILKATENGDVQVLCNRFVLREGIDLPHIAHAIFACVVGSLRSWLQMGGRVLRAHPRTPIVTIQDHGANFRRHGSLNTNRHWELGQSGYKTTGLRIEGMRERPETEPITCPRCHTMRLSGPKCVNPECGYEYHKRSKTVVQVDGTLKLVEGATYKPHYTKTMPDTERKWIAMYHRACSKKWDGTFRQAAANFVQENHYWPPNNLPFMPKDKSDWFSKCRDVPRDRLT
jgi:superfamily II DNA or RNA helicase